MESIDDTIKEIIIARLETLNQNSKVLLLGEKEPISVKDMIQEIKDNSDLGKKIVEVQFAYMKMLVSGELDL